MVMSWLFQLVPAAPSSPPTNIQISGVSSTGFLVSWTTPPIADHNGIIRNYVVNTTEENTGRHLLFTSRTNSQRVDSIHPYYNYTCIVAAITVSAGPFSAAIVITTAESGIIVLCGRIMMTCLFNSPQWPSNKLSNGANFLKFHSSHMEPATASWTQWHYHQLHCHAHFRAKYHYLHCKQHNAQHH